LSTVTSREATGREELGGAEGTPDILRRRVTEPRP